MNAQKIYDVLNAVFMVLYIIDWSNSTWESICFKEESWIDREYFSVGSYWNLRNIIQLSTLFKKGEYAIKALDKIQATSIPSPIQSIKTFVINF